MSQDFTFNPPPWAGQPELIAELWTLHKQGRRAACTLWNHRDGVAVRLDVDGRDSRTHVSGDVETLLDVAVRWNTELIAKAGWSERE